MKILKNLSFLLHWFFWLFQFTVVQNQKTVVHKVPLQQVQMVVAIQMMVAVQQTSVSVLTFQELKAFWRPLSWVRKPQEPKQEVQVRGYSTNFTSVMVLQREKMKLGNGSLNRSARGESSDNGSATNPMVDADGKSSVISWTWKSESFILSFQRMGKPLYRIDPGYDKWGPELSKRRTYKKIYS